MTTMFEQLPPHDIGAEQAVLGSLLVDDRAVFKVQPLLQPGDFFRDHHRWLYEVALTLALKDAPVNEITAAHELERRGQLEEAGGLVFLSDLVLNLATPVGVESWARMVRDASARRQLITMAMTLATIAYQEGSIEQALQGGEDTLTHLRQRIAPPRRQYDGSTWERLTARVRRR